MAQVLIVYATRSGDTKDIADLIAEGVRFTGAEAKVINVTEIKKEAYYDNTTTLPWFQ
jgi:flavodoxin